MKTLKIIYSVVLTLFGGLSLFMTLSIIFDLFGIRAMEGNYVLFIVYANLICAVIYLFAAYAVWKSPEYGAYSMALASLILILAFVALQIYINKDGIYEVKTVKAMIFRTMITVVMSALGYYIFQKSTINKSSKS